jgi:chromosome partitioning protein
MRCIAVINQKGGVGKTTTTLNTAAGLARENRRVLLVDMDPQAHLTYSLGLNPQELDQALPDLLAERAEFQDVVQPIQQNLDLLPATQDLLDVDQTAGPRETLLRNALEQAPDYDFILLDCPPNLGLLSVNAMAAAREIFIPLQAEFLALQSMSRLLHTVEAVRAEINPGLEITGIVATRFSRQKKLNREVVKNIQDYFGDKLFETRIRENVSLAEAPSFGLDIFSYRPRSNGAQDYRNLCREILRQGG